MEPGRRWRIVAKVRRASEAIRGSNFARKASSYFLGLALGTGLAICRLRFGVLLSYEAFTLRNADGETPFVAAWVC